ICHNNQDVHTLFECQILRSSQSHAGGCNTFNGWVVCQIGKEHSTVNGTSALKLTDEKFGFFKGNTNGSKYNGEVTFTVQNLCLTGNLGSQSSVRQTRTGK